MSIFPSSPIIGDQYSGYMWNGTVWEVVGSSVIGVSQSDLDSVEALALLGL